MPAAAVHCARDQTFLWVNPRYASWMARPAAGIIGRKLGEVIGAEAMRAIEPYIERVLKGEQVQYERLARFAGLGERWLSWMYMPTYGAGREPDGWVAIGTDIHDRKLAEEALKAEHQRKDEFLAALAHELRNPLAPIRNAVAILARKGPQDPEVAWSQSVIERQVEQLSRLIGDLVDIERIARGKLALHAERVPLEQIVDMALESSRPHVNAAGHHLSVLLPSERAMIEGDPARLAQAFATLLKNAAKHTPAQGTITLSAAVEGRRGGGRGRGQRRRLRRRDGAAPVHRRRRRRPAPGAGHRRPAPRPDRGAQRRAGSRRGIRHPPAAGAWNGKSPRAGRPVCDAIAPGARARGRRQPRRRRLAAARARAARARSARRVRRRHRAQDRPGISGRAWRCWTSPCPAATATTWRARFAGSRAGT